MACCLISSEYSRVLPLSVYLYLQRLQRHRCVPDWLYPVFTWFSSLLHFGQQRFCEELSVFMLSAYHAGRFLSTTGCAQYFDQFLERSPFCPGYAPKLFVFVFAHLFVLHCSIPLFRIVYHLFAIFARSLVWK